MRRLLLLLVFLLVLTSSASAVTYVGYSGNTGNYNCDGTNDEVQINQAIAAARSTSDHIVYLNGPHTYWIDAPILIYDNIKLTGNSGAVVKLITDAGWGAGVPLIRGYTSSPFSTSTSAGSGYGDNFEMYGFTIDANCRTRSTQGDLASYGSGFYSIMQFHGISNVKVHDMVIQYGGGDGLCTRSSSNIQFYDNTVTDLGHDVYYCMYGSGGTFHDNYVKTRTNSACRLTEYSSVTIYNNYVYSEHTSGRTGPGMQFDSNAPATSRYEQDIDVHDNIFDTIWGSGIWMVAEYDDTVKRARNVKIHNNIFKKCGWYSAHYSDSGINIFQFDNTQIYNNVFDDCGRAGIKYVRFYKSSTSNAVLQDAYYTNYIRNNIIMDTRGSTYETTGVAILSEGDNANRNTFVVNYNDIYNNEVNFASVNIQQSNNLYVAPLLYEGIGSGMRYSPYSKYGRYTGGAWVTDAIQSPMIDAGTPYSSTDPVTYYANEPEDNGNRVNIGRWGNTAYASKSGGGGGTTTPPIVQFTAASYSITQGSSVNIYWGTTGATSVSISPGIGSVATSGTRSVTPSTSTTYTLTAVGPGGTTTKSITITVVPGAPTCTLTADKTSVTSGSAVKLTYTFSGTVTSASISGYGSVPATSGSSVYVYPTSTTTYTLTVSGPGGTGTANRQITVTATPIYPEISSFNSNKSASYSGDGVLLSWNVLRASSITISQGVGGVGSSGSTVVYPTSNISYMMTASNSNGSITAYRNVTVLTQPVVTPMVNITDTRIKSSTPNSNFKDLGWLDLGAFDPTTGAKYRDFVWVNTSGYGQDTVVDDAKLNLYWYYADGRNKPTTIDVYRPTAWTESGVTWNSNGSRSWNNPGGDWYDKNGVAQGSTPYASLTIPAGTPTNQYFQIDITDLMQEYISGEYNNTGILLKSRNESNDYVAFRSLEYASGKPYVTFSVGEVSISNPSPMNTNFDLMNGSRQDFSVELSKVGNVKWYVDGNLTETDSLVSAAEFSKVFSVVGSHTVEVRTSTDSVTWYVSVNEIPPVDPPIPYIPDGNAYVSWMGSDTTGDGSISKPYATVTKAMTLPIVGSLTINVMGGDYTENVVVTDDNIKISNYEGIPSFNGLGIAFDAADITNFTIEDICIGGYQVGVSGSNVSSLVVNNVTISDSGSYGIYVAQSGSVAVSGSRFYSNTEDAKYVDVGNVSGIGNVYSGYGDKGVVANDCGNVSLDGEKWTWKTYGVEVDEVDSVSVSDCRWDMVGSGIRIGNVSEFSSVNNSRVNLSEMYAFGGGYPTLNVTYWNLSDAEHMGVVTIDNSRPDYVWNFNLTESVSGWFYSLYDVTEDEIVSSVLSAGTGISVRASGLLDGEYWLVKSSTGEVVDGTSRYAFGNEYTYEFKSANQYEPLYLYMDGDDQFEYLYLFNKEDLSANKTVVKEIIHDGTNVSFGMYTDSVGEWNWISHGSIVKTEITNNPTYNMSNVQNGDGVLAVYDSGNVSYQVWWQKFGEYVEPPIENEGASIVDFSPDVLQFNTSVGTRQSFYVSLDGTDDIKWTVNGNLLRFKENVTSDTFKYRLDDLGSYVVTASTAKSIYTWNIYVSRGG